MELNFLKELKSHTLIVTTIFLSTCVLYGFLLIFIFQNNLFLSLDILRLLILSLAITFSAIFCNLLTILLILSALILNSTDKKINLHRFLVGVLAGSSILNLLFFMIFFWRYSQKILNITNIIVNSTKDAATILGIIFILYIIINSIEKKSQ